ncbi:type II toxin-antitoxin system RelE/ParE family toxin [Hydrogenimonas sp.]
MTFRFHPEAAAELEAAADYYESCRPGLGDEFLDEVERALDLMLRFPDAWQKLDDGIRRVLTHRFPFGIVYVKDGGKIIVLAVMQLNRKPGYWRSRK